MNHILFQVLGCNRFVFVGCVSYQVGSPGNPKVDRCVEVDKGPDLILIWDRKACLTTIDWYSGMAFRSTAIITIEDGAMWENGTQTVGFSMYRRQRTQINVPSTTCVSSSTTDQTSSLDGERRPRKMEEQE